MVNNGRVLDLKLRACWLNSESVHYQMATSWMGDCLHSCEPSWYIININSAVHPYRVGKLSTSLSGWG